MKLREIFRFELAYQARRVSTWIYFAVLLVVSLNAVRGNYLADARRGDFFLNSPLVIASSTVLCCLLWLLVAAAVAGDAATRDVHTRMSPLTYTAPVRKRDYLGGRFLAAFALNAMILLAAPGGIFLALTLPGVEPEVLGPSRPAAYFVAYGFIALPNAFAATAIQFSMATLRGRALAAYLGSFFLFVTAYVVAPALAAQVQRGVGKLVDPVGVVGIISEMSSTWTPIEKQTRLLALEGSLLWNRLLWIGIALAVLAFTYQRFRFAHPATRARRGRFRRRQPAPVLTPAPAVVIARSTPIAVPSVPRSFGFASQARQTLAIGWASFRAIAGGWTGLVLLGLLALLAVVFVPFNVEFMDVPLYPRTDHVLPFLTAPLTDTRTPWILIPLLTVLYAGEMTWRERDARVADIVDATPVPDWVLFLGKFLALGLVLVSWMALLTLAGMLVQVRMGYHDFEIGRYLQVLFGLQLVDYLLFALLALLAQTLVNQKYVGLLAALVAYGLIAFAAAFGIEHKLLVYGAAPEWSYTDMRGFGGSLGPWLWFKLYWMAWALLFAVVARLLWVRGREGGFGARVRLARRRLSLPTAGAAAAAVALILGLGGFVFYNTNVLNAYTTAEERTERHAEYRRLYGRYDGVPQPRLTGTSLRVDIHPREGEVRIRGTYRLANRSTVAIDSIHVATDPAVETGAILFDRPARRVLADEDLGHSIYALDTPLQPGDSVRLTFQVRVEPRGFGNGGADESIVANGTYFTNQDWLPAIGFHPGGRTAGGAGIPSLYGAGVRRDRADAQRIAFDAVVSTDGNQTAVAPGALRRAWTEGGRRYFHYVANAPILNEYAFFSADYAVHEARWNDVAIQVFHDPGHTANLERMVRSVRAALDYYTEHFGPYPYDHIRLIERPGHGFALHADAINIAYDEGFTLMHPEKDPRGLDLPFAVVAHEVAHQWWGARLRGAYVEGSPLLGESLAQYSAMRVVAESGGPGQLDRLLGFMRTAYEAPRTRAGVPLLRATDSFFAYRRGPFALYALSEYIGEERMNVALRSFFEKHGSGTPPLPTSLDLYRELQAVTPDSLRYLVRDLFEANTYWELRTEAATARQAGAGTWQVTLDVRARKVAVDSAGVEAVVPMDEWVEIGVFAPAGKEGGEPLYRGMHRIRSGRQTVTVTVSGEPARAGIDPRHLLTDSEMEDNFTEVKIDR